MYILSDVISSVLYPFRCSKKIWLSIVVTALVFFLYQEAIMTPFLMYLFSNERIGSFLHNTLSNSTYMMVFQTIFSFLVNYIPHLFFISAISVAIVRNIITDQKFPFFVFEKALNERELSVFKSWMKFLLVTFIATMIVVQLSYTKGSYITSPWPFREFLTLMYGLFAIANEQFNLWAAYGSQQVSFAALLPILSSLLSVVVTYISWSILGLTVISSALGENGGFKRAYQMAKGKWVNLALTLLAIDIIFCSISIPLSYLHGYLRGIEFSYRFAEVDSLYGAVSPTLYMDYISFPNLSFVLLISMYLAALSKFYVKVSKDEGL